MVLRFFCGMVGALIAGTITFPTDTVRRRLQIQGFTTLLFLSSSFPFFRGSVHSQSSYKGAIDCTVKVFKNEGFRALYRGISTHMIKAVPGTALKLVIYDLFKKLTGLTEYGG